MTGTVRVAVPRKGRPLEAVLERLAGCVDAADVADDVTSTLRYEKAITKGETTAEADVYERLAAYSDLAEPYAPEYSLLRDDRDGDPRRIVFDSLAVPVPDEPFDLRLIGREEPFRALRTHSFALGFDSADLVLEEVVPLREAGIESIAAVNERIDPHDTDVRIVSGLGDVVHHTLLATPETLPPGATLDREFVAGYGGSLCLAPRYERLVEAVLGTRAVADVTFVHPSEDVEEEAAVAETGLGVYLTETGATAREHGLVVGEHLFPSETVLLENRAETDAADECARALLVDRPLDTAIRV